MIKRDEFNKAHGFLWAATKDEDRDALMLIGGYVHQLHEQAEEKRFARFVSGFVCGTGSLALVASVTAWMLS